MVGLSSPVNGCGGLVHSFPHLSQKKLNEKFPVSEWSIDFFVSAFRNIREMLSLVFGLTTCKIYSFGGLGLLILSGLGEFDTDKFIRVRVCLHI